MGKSIQMFFALVGVSLAFSGTGEARTVRATELGPALFSQLRSGDDITVEFRQGDQLPVSFVSEGDLLESVRPVAPTYVLVKKNFWLKMQGSDVQISFDGQTFKPISDLVSGTITAGAETANQSGGAADAINIVFKAVLR